jgi:hypothetical protein
VNREQIAGERGRDVHWAAIHADDKLRLPDEPDELLQARAFEQIGGVSMGGMATSARPR